MCQVHRCCMPFLRSHYLVVGSPCVPCSNAYLPLLERAASACLNGQHVSDILSKYEELLASRSSSASSNTVQNGLSSLARQTLEVFKPLCDSFA
mmetsp:Transcript_14384/g.33116  ORF Transcript_14384/g.33116 Transcript_14384/m.33116 type:complete len:94 (-) Transcript_14384:66-347(-)